METLGDNAQKADGIETTLVTDRHRWFPSRRAIFAAMVLMIPWMLITVPSVTSPPSQGVQLRTFGWPYVHCWNFEANDDVDVDFLISFSQIPEIVEILEPWQSVDYFQRLGQPNDYPVWSKSDHWRYWGSSTRKITWYRGPLLANAAIGMGIYLVILVVLEWRIRKRGGLFRFRLMDAFVAAVILAIPLATLGNTLAGSARDERLLNELRELGATETGTRSGAFAPIWLNRLMDNRLTSLISQVDSKRSLSRVTEIDLSRLTFVRPVDHAAFARIAQIINDFDRLEVVTIGFTKTRIADLLESIDSQRVIELTVKIGPDDLTESEAAGLANCTEVRKLSVGPIMLWADFPGNYQRVSPTKQMTLLSAIKPMTKLRELELHWMTIREVDCPGLLDFPSLESISCLSITAEAREILLESSPGLKIVCNPK